MWCLRVKILETRTGRCMRSILQNASKSMWPADFQASDSMTGWLSLDMKTIENIRLVLGYRNYAFLFISVSILFWILFGFLLGLQKLPLLDWNLLQQSVVWELFLPNLAFILLAGILNALLLTFTIFRLKELQSKLNPKESSTGFLGVGLTSVFAACPFCAISLASVFGVSFVTTFIAPYYLEFQFLSIFIVLASFYWTSSKLGQECIACQIQTQKKN